MLFERRHRHGDVERAFAGAAVVVTETFRHARLSASPLEPRGIVARWEGDALTVWTGTQIPHVVRAALAQAFGLAERQVRVIVPDTGGGFGQKMHVMPEDLAVAAAARLIDRPVKWTETRRENLAAASQAREARVEIEAAADARGVLLGLRARIWSDAGSPSHLPAHGRRSSPWAPRRSCRARTARPPMRTTSWPSPRTSRRSARIAASA